MTGYLDLISVSYDKRRSRRSSWYDFWFLVIANCLIVSCSASSICAQTLSDIPTPTQLRKLWEASLGRYQTWDVAYTVTSYPPDEGGIPVREKQSISKIIWRKAGGRIYGESFNTQLSGYPADEREIRKFMVTPEWSRSLHIISADKVMTTGPLDRRNNQLLPTGRINREQNFSTVLLTTVEEVLRYPFSKGLLNSINDENTSITRDEKTGHILISTQLPGGASFEYELDPNKHWIPAGGKLRNQEHTIVLENMLTDFKEVSAGIWIPMSYTIRSSIGVVVYTIDTAKINSDIPESSMGFEFAVGTKVTDEIVGAQYKVGELRQNAQPGLATDSQLQAASERAGFSASTFRSNTRNYTWQILTGALLAVAAMIGVAIAWRRAGKPG